MAVFRFRDDCIKFSAGEDGGGGDGRAERAGAPPPPPQAANRGRLVTPPIHFSRGDENSLETPDLEKKPVELTGEPFHENFDPTKWQDVTEWKFLWQGMDSLYLNFYVEWNMGWATLQKELQEGKEKASGRDQIPWKELNGQTISIWANAMRMFRYHLETEYAKIYIGISPVTRDYPNVHVEFFSPRLKTDGWPKCLKETAAVVRALGGRIRRIQPSRVDLSVDYFIPSGLSYDFLRAHLVSHAHKFRLFGDKKDTECHYLGHQNSPAQLRTYHKTKEAAQNYLLPLYWKIWGASYRKNVWRIEFQLRRECLREFEIDTLSDLLAKSGGIWRYFTEEWCGLRLLDNPNSARRTTHPFWKDVQSRASGFGKVCTVKKRTKLSIPDIPRHLALIGGLSETAAALCGFLDMKPALNHIRKLLLRRKTTEEYREAIKAKAIKLRRLGLHFDTTPEKDEGAYHES